MSTFSVIRCVNTCGLHVIITETSVKIRCIKQFVFNMFNEVKTRKSILNYLLYFLMGHCLYSIQKFELIISIQLRIEPGCG